MGRSIQVGAELHPVLTHLPQLVEAEDLKSAGIGKHGAGPGDEAVQSAEPANQLMPRAQVQVIGIGKNDLRVQLFEQMLGDGLDRPRGAHRHEGRSLDQPMGKCYGRPPCLSTDGFYLKSERHSLILA